MCGVCCWGEEVRFDPAEVGRGEALGGTEEDRWVDDDVLAGEGEVEAAVGLFRLMEE